MHAVSDLSPVKWGVFGLDGVAWRELSWPEPARSLMALVVMGVVGFGIGLGRRGQMGEMGF